VKQATKLRQGSDYYAAGILRGERIVLAQSITLIESTLPSDQQLAAEIMDKVIHATGNSIRIGISGPPGVGKSTFIETFGSHITSDGKKLAVLTIDPSSPRTKGSILGDKTRMSELATNPMAFIRPSASADALGGVAHKTRETILLCEAAGFDVVLVETVGVGQSEVTVKNMTDVFLLLMLAGSGDELQGIKKGIMEMADLIVITKADGDNIRRANEARNEFQHAIHLLFNQQDWIPKVLTASAVANDGIGEAWKEISQYVDFQTKNNLFDEKRKLQNITHLHERFQHLLRSEIEQSEQLQKVRQKLEERVSTRSLSPTQGGQLLFDAFKSFIESKRS
jgi:LAO/AO transport system kinase